jgi:ASC-1-like (ASCH) protein
MIKENFIHHREQEPFENIKKGLKKMEIRLYDEKRQKIKKGNIIKIINRENPSQELFVKVIGLSRFPSFKKLFEVFGDKINSYEKKILKRIYSKADEEKYGILVIHFELVKFK